ncbi:MAG: hypothetical protein ACPGO7_00835 [Alphaproteobacteria bacterium]
MSILTSFLNSKVWLMIAGAFLVILGSVGLISGQAAESASTFWPNGLTDSELNIAKVIEVVWTVHVLGMGIILFAIGLLAANPIGARIGSIGMIAVLGSQFMAGGLAAGYGYAGFEGFNAFAAVFMFINLVTLISCLSKINAK